MENNLKIIIKEGNLFQRFLGGMFNTKTNEIFVWSKPEISRFGCILAHEIGHYNYEQCFKDYPLWKKILAKLFSTHEIMAITNENNFYKLYKLELRRKNESWRNKKS